MAYPAISPANSVLLCLLMILSASSCFSYDAAAAAAGGGGNEGYLRCFLNHSVPSDVLYAAGNAAYEKVFESSIQNLRFLSPENRRPALIVTPKEEAHVQVAVGCSRTHGVRLRVRSGGHDYEGLSYVSPTADGSPFAVLDLTNLRAITVDLRTSTAWVGAGATVGELYYSIAEHSPRHGFPASICPTPGVGGVLSGGGIGTLMRKHGLAADNVVDARLVDAQGRILTRSTMGEDLFWAIRGGGAVSFGVVLAFRVRLVVVPPTTTVFTVGRTRQQDAAALMEKWQNVADKFVDDLFIRVLAQAQGDGPNRTASAAFQCLYLGGAKALLAYLGKTFPELGVRAQDVKELAWIDAVLYFAGFDGGRRELLIQRSTGPDHSFKAKSDFVEQPIPKEGWDKIFDFLVGSTGEPAVLIVDPLGGRLDTVPADATPFPHRKGSRYNIQYFLSWPGKEAAGHLRWMRELYALAAPYVSCNPRAAYLNYKDIDLGRNGGAGNDSFEEASAWGSSYFKGNFKRLASVKAEVDPDNFFWSEQSVPPLAAR